MQKEAGKKVVYATKAGIRALDRSIEHWERLANRTAREGIGRSARALCNLYYYSACCQGCPVATDTGRPGCERTPAIDTRFACAEESPQFRTAARRMLRYLVGLRKRVRVRTRTVGKP
jgi:hypothetical protein